MTGVRRADVALAAVLVVAGAAEALLVDGVPNRPVAAVFAVVSGVALAWRRTAPLVTAIAVGGGQLAGAALLGTSLDAVLVPAVVVLLAAYSAGSTAGRGQARMGLAALLAGAAVSVVAEEGLATADLGFAAVLVVSAWLAGSAHRARAAYAEALEDRAAALERERDSRAAEAVAAERLRIARELHDVVTHALSVMTLQAGGVRRLLPPTADREQEALRAVERTGRQALGEMARMLGVLRAGSGGPDLRPHPGLLDLAELAAQVTASGVETRVRVDGEPFDLPPSLDLSAYRIAQEALTNVLKHSGAGRAEVHLGYEPGQLHLQVHDDGKGAAFPAPDGRGDPHAGGHGLVGMRERVAVFGGTIETGSAPGGGYRVSARLPVPRDGR